MPPQTAWTSLIEHKMSFDFSSVDRPKNQILSSEERSFQRNRVVLNSSLSRELDEQHQVKNIENLRQKTRNSIRKKIAKRDFEGNCIRNRTTLARDVDQEMLREHLSSSEVQDIVMIWKEGFIQENTNSQFDAGTESQIIQDDPRLSPTSSCCTFDETENKEDFNPPLVNRTLGEALALQESASCYFCPSIDVGDLFSSSIACFPVQRSRQKKITKRVQFLHPVVTEERKIPRLRSKDVRRLFYSKDDMMRFRFECNYDLDSAWENVVIQLVYDMLAWNCIGKENVDEEI